MLLYQGTSITGDWLLRLFANDEIVGVCVLVAAVMAFDVLCIFALYYVLF